MSIPTFPAAAARALAFLKRKNSDIEIFVEDSSNPNVWLYYIRQHLKSNASLDSVNILGSRSQVLAACALDQGQRPEKRLYLIDGDIDIALGRPKPRLKHLYRLPAYCIENMLISEKGLIEVATACDVMVTEARATSRLDYTNFSTSNGRTLLTLFIVYAALIDLKVPEKTVSLGASSLFVPNGRGKVRFCPKKVYRRKRALLKSAAIIYDLPTLRNKLRSIKEYLKVRNIDYENVVSAKDYTLVALMINFRYLFKFTGNSEQFKVHLAQKPHVRLDSNLKRRLTLALK
ncbi:MAG: DUF4435 domain-containing protein [Rhodobacteraceae bacterium]|nr:DUF4435 domain-containing protein [Paracoccaceae bacterium]